MKAIPIHKAKANLSKYIAEAKKGKSIYIGSYGQAEVVIEAVVPNTMPLWGLMKNSKPLSDREWDKLDKLIAHDFEDAINKPFPGE